MEVRHSVQERRPRFNLQKFAQSIITPEGFTLEGVSMEDSNNPNAVRLRLSTALMEDGEDLIDVDLELLEGANETMIELMCAIPNFSCPEEATEDAIDEGDILRQCAGAINNERRGPVKIVILEEDGAYWILFSITLVVPHVFLKSPKDHTKLSELVGYNTAFLLEEGRELHDCMSAALGDHLRRVTIH